MCCGFITCIAVSAGVGHAASLVMELQVSSPEEAESMSLCVNVPGLKSCGCLTLFLA